MSGKTRPLQAENTFSNELLQSIFIQVADGIFIADNQGRYIDVNPCGCEMLGYTRREILKLSIRDLVSPEDLSNNPIKMDDLRAGKTIVSEHFLRCKDGTLLPVEISAQMLSNGHLLGIVRDVTERKQIEEAILHNESRLRALIENSLDQISLLAADGSLLWESPATIRPLGYQPHEFLRHNIFELMHPDDLESIQKRYAKLIQEPGSRQSSSFRLRHANGTWRWIEAVATNLLHEPSVEAIVINYRDITERVRAEEAVKKSEERYRHLFINNPHPMWVYDLKTLAFLAVNDAAIAKYGYTREEFLGMTIADIRPKEDLPRLTENLARPRTVLEHSEGWRHCLKDGTIIEVEISSHALNFDESESALVIAQDVTERKKAEARIRYVTRLYATLSQVNQTIVRVKQRNELFNAICKVAVEFGQFRMAWVGLLDNKTGDVNPVAHAGFEEGYLRSIKININDELLGKGLTGIAIRTGKVVFIDDIDADPRMGPWREQASKRDYHSFASVPIRLKGMVFGVLNLYATETNFFSDEELRLLEEIGTDISFALDTIETEIQHKRAEEALIESERRYRHALSNMMEGCQIIDHDWRYIYINDAAARQGHHKPGELLMRTMMEIYPGIEETELFKVLRVCMEEHRPHRIENKFIFPDGATGWFELSIQPVPEGLFILSIDITERKQAEENYRNIFENAMEGIFQSTPNGNFINVNPAMAHIYGYTSSQEMIQSITDISRQLYVNPDDHSEFMRQMETHGEVRNYEDRVFRKDRRTLWVSTSARAVRDDKGNIAYCEGFLQDITSRKKAEDDLRESEDRYRDLVENSRELICTHDLEGKILSANKWALKMLDVETEEDLIGKNIADFVAPEHKAEFRNYLDTVQREGRAQGIMLVQKANGDRRIWEYNNSLRTEGVSTPIVRGMAIDVTERRQAEAQLRASEEKYRSLFNNVPDGVYRTSVDGHLLAANPALVQMLGYDSADELQKVSIDDLYVDPKERRSYVNLLNNENEIHSMEVRLKRKDGHQIIGLDNSKAVRDEKGTISYFEGTLTDITDSKQAEQKIQQQLNRITALREIDQAITSSFNLHLTMNRIISKVVEQLGADASAILIFDQNTYTLDYVVTHGLRDGTIHTTGIQLGQGLAGNVALERRITHHSDLRKMTHNLPELEALIIDGFIDYYGIPLISKGQLRGILEVFHRSPLSSEREWLEYLETIAGQAAIAIDNIQMFDGLQRSNFELAHAYDATIEGWSRALDLRDKETEGHTQRVTGLTLELARVFGLGEKELTDIRRGALLHDIGKMGVPDAILLKPGELTEDEWSLMKKHPLFAYEMLSPIQYLRDALDIPHYHHEKWDGTGYPEGLKGEQIPLAARLFAIVDIWDAVRSDRPYRPAWSEAKALEYIKGLSGIHLDPQVVKIFFESKIYQMQKNNK